MNTETDWDAVDAASRAALNAGGVFLTHDQHEDLLDRAAKLIALENGGVSNWDWYDASLEEYWANKREMAKAIAGAIL